MPSTVVTTAELPALLAREVEEMIRLRIKAGAIRGWREGGSFSLEWDAIGEQDKCQRMLGRAA